MTNSNPYASSSTQEHKALSSIVTASWNPFKESLSNLHPPQSFHEMVLSFPSPVLFTFPGTTLTNQLEILHRATRMVITGCLSFISFPLPFLRPSLLPRTSEQQELSCFERLWRSLRIKEETLLEILLLISRRTPPS